MRTTIERDDRGEAPPTARIAPHEHGIALRAHGRTFPVPKELVEGSDRDIANATRSILRREIVQRAEKEAEFARERAQELRSRAQESAARARRDTSTAERLEQIAAGRGTWGRRARDLA